jgi:hypothetical protein
MHGGQPPVVGARIYVLSPAQSTTPGTASVSLLTSGDGSDQIGFYVLTDENGDFRSLSGLWSCPTPNTPIYLYGAGGQAQSGYTNAAISQAVYVGPCDTINSGTTLLMDEVTTVAMAYAVAGYATDLLHISYSGSPASVTGIENAFANASNLANSEYGVVNSPTIPSGNASVPYETVNTLADADASCINQTSGGDNCSTFFSAAPVNVNGVAPTDTATAIVNIAHNPANSTSVGIQNGTNIGSILSLAQNYKQFLPILDPTSPPNDLTLGLTFTDSNFGNPTALAIDGSGNAWIASQTSSSLPTGSVVEIANPATMLANNATYLTLYTPLTEPDSITVDAASQNIWIGTDGGVEEFSTTGGAPASGSPFLTSDPNFVGPSFALNLDTAGNVWIAGYSTVYELSPMGSVLSSSGGYPLYTGALQATAAPSALALDASNNVWVTDYSNYTLVELNSQGTNVNTLGQSGGVDPYSAPNGVAIDASKDVWAANNGNNNLVEYIPNQQTSLIYFPAVTASSSSTPLLTFVGIDGAGNSWSSLQNAACISSSVCLGVAETSGAGKPLSGPGYSISNNGGGNATANATAIDGSGNVWILNKYAPSVTELVGAAIPVVTPLALAVSSNSLGVRP